MLKVTRWRARSWIWSFLTRVPERDDWLCDHEDHITNKTIHLSHCPLSPKDRCLHTGCAWGVASLHGGGCLMPHGESRNALPCDVHERGSIYSTASAVQNMPPHSSPYWVSPRSHIYFPGCDVASLNNNNNNNNINDGKRGLGRVPLICRSPSMLPTWSSG